MNLFVERFMEIIAIIFVSYMLLYTTFWLLAVLFGAIRMSDKGKMNRLKNEIKHDYYMPISILVPAFNEEVTIIDTVKSMLQLDYKLFEIIIIDDGSTDRTVEKLLQTFSFIQKNRPINRKLPCTKEDAVYEARINIVNLTLITKENSGKSDSLNMGINVAKFPYFVTLDADSLLLKNSLEKIIQPVLENRHIIAVGGMVQVAQPVKMVNGEITDYRIPWQPIIGMQVVEYDRSFLASRILLDQFNGNLIVSGAFGLYKKDVVIAVGGYKSDTVGEDMELIMRLHTFMLEHQYPYKIHYQPDALCLSQSPSSLLDVFKQRRRWHMGLFQSMIRYPELILKFRYKPIGFISYIYYIIFELLGPIIEVFGILTIVLAWQFDLLNVPFMINLFIIYTAYGIFLSLTVFFQSVYIQNIKLHALDVVKAIILTIAEAAIYRYIISFVRLTSFIGYKHKQKGWETVKRTKYE